MESSRELEERAGAWLAKRESGNWSAEDQARLTQWLNAATANRVAFLRQESAWEHALRLEALRGNTPQGAVPSPAQWRLSPFISDGAVEASPRDVAAETGESRAATDVARPAVSRRRWMRGALAATLVLAVAGALTWHLATRGPYYHTPVGGLASVPLSDGSKVTLNTDSAIRLAVTEHERGVRLERGEAFFEVAKDPGRPFVVSAGNKRVIAVGTKFSVRRAGDDVRVFVTEGRVRLEDESLSPARRDTMGSANPAPGKSVSSDENAVLLAAGTMARAGDSGVIVQDRPLTEVEDYLSWRSGYLTFHDIPLADAVAELNRYNEQKIIIQDPAVAAIRFSGKVRPTSFEGFVRLLEGAFPIRASHAEGRIVLTNSGAGAGSSGERTQ